MNKLSGKYFKFKRMADITPSWIGSIWRFNEVDEVCVTPFTCIKHRDFYSGALVPGRNRDTKKFLARIDIMPTLMDQYPIERE